MCELEKNQGSSFKSTETSQKSIEFNKNELLLDQQKLSESITHPAVVGELINMPKVLFLCTQRPWDLISK